MHTFENTGAGIKRHYYGLNALWDEWVDVRIALNEEKAKECGVWDPVGTGAYICV